MLIMNQAGDTVVNFNRGYIDINKNKLEYVDNGITITLGFYETYEDAKAMLMTIYASYGAGAKYMRC